MYNVSHLCLWIRIRIGSQGLPILYIKVAQFVDNYLNTVFHLNFSNSLKCLKIHDAVLSCTLKICQLPY